MAENDNLPLILQELGGQRRRIELTGPDLPRGNEGFLTFGGDTRDKRTWYPGSDVCTYQSLGPEPQELSFAGEFNAGRLGRTGPAPEQLVFDIEALREAGEQVQVSWGPYTKVCSWGQCQFTVATTTRVRYSLRFRIIQVDARGPLLLPGGEIVRIARRARDIPSVAAILSAAGEILSALSALPPGLGGDRINRAIGTVNSIISTGNAAGAVLDTFRSVGAVVLPGQAMGALRFIDSVRDHTRDLLETVRALSWTSMLGGGFGVLSTAGVQALSMSASVVDLAGSVLTLHGRVRQLAGDTRSDALYVAAQGDTLRTIAQRFYQSADRWREVADANGLASTMVEPGTQLVIPRVGVGAEVRP